MKGWPIGGGTVLLPGAPLAVVRILMLVQRKIPLRYLYLRSCDGGWAGGPTNGGAARFTCKDDYIGRIPACRIRWNGWPNGPVCTGPPVGGVGRRKPSGENFGEGEDQSCEGQNSRGR